MGFPFALAVGAVTFLLGVIWGGPLIEVLRRFGVGKLIRSELGERQQRKVGTPTMGGLLIIVSVVVLTAGLNIANVVRQVSGASILLPTAVLLGFGVLGAIDDREGIQRSRGPVGEGLSGRVKFAAQVVLAVIVSVFISTYEGGRFLRQIRSTFRWSPCPYRSARSSSSRSAPFSSSRRPTRSISPMVLTDWQALFRPALSWPTASSPSCRTRFT